MEVSCCLVAVHGHSLSLSRRKRTQETPARSLCSMGQDREEIDKAQGPCESTKPRSGTAM